MCGRKNNEWNFHAGWTPPTAATFATAVAALAGSGGLLVRKNAVVRHSRNISHVKATAKNNICLAVWLFLFRLPDTVEASEGGPYANR